MLPERPTSKFYFPGNISQEPAGLSSNNHLSNLSYYLEELFLSPLSEGGLISILSSPHVLQVLNAYDLHIHTTWKSFSWLLWSRVHICTK